MLPFVSLIIPTLNEEEYLEQTISSLLSNDYPSNKFELLIVDGLSKDNTVAIAQGLAKKFPNIRLMSNSKINMNNTSPKTINHELINIPKK